MDVSVTKTTKSKETRLGIKEDYSQKKVDFWQERIKNITLRQWVFNKNEEIQIIQKYNGNENFL